MADGTKIEWTHRPGTIPATMNALVGCQKVSEGCRNCYAIDVAHVRAGNPLQVMQDKFAGTTKREGGKTLWTGKVTLTEKALLAPLHAKKPRTYFVNSMSDLFMDGVPDEWIDKHFAVFALCPQHTFIVLTKRPERMLAYLSERPQAVWHRKALDIDVKALPMLTAQVWPPPNVWLGVSVENQKAADKRIPLLLQTPAAVRFLSCEPLLRPVDLSEWVSPPLADKQKGMRASFAAHMLNKLAPRLDWVIAGGESGANARPMHPDWARALRDQCAAAGVPFFFKQWGQWTPGENVAAVRGKVHAATWWNNCWEYSTEDVAGNEGHRDDEVDLYCVGKKAAGHLLDGVEHHAFPEVR